MSPESLLKSANTPAVAVAADAPPTPAKPARTATSGWLGRLPVGQKLALAGLLLGLPFIATSGLLITQQGHQLRQLQTQLEGQRVLVPLDKAITTSQLLLLSSVQLAQGNQSVKDANAQQRQQVRQLLQQVQTGATSAGLGGIGTQVTKALSNLEDINSSLDKHLLSPLDAQAAYDDLLRDDVLPIFDSVAQAARFKMATDDEIGQLTEAAGNTIPQNVLNAGIVVADTLTTLAAMQQTKTDTVNPLVHRLLSEQWSISNAARLKILGEVKQITKAYPATSAQLTPKTNELQQGSEALFSAIQSGVLAPAKVHLSAAQLAALSPAAIGEVSGGLNSLMQTVTDTLGQRLEARIAAEQRNRWLLTLAVLAAAALLTGLLYLISRAITQPLARLTDASRQLSNGRFNVHVPVTTTDELGTLTRTFNTAAAQLRRNAEQTERERLEAQRLQQHVGEFLNVTMDIAGGDLTRRGQVTEDMLGHVVNSINLMVEELAQTLRNVQSASQSVTDGSRTMLASTDQIGAGATSANEQTQQVVRQAAEVNARIQAMAQVAQASAETARQALRASQQGQEAVAGTLNGIAEIRTSSQSVAERLQGLVRRSEEIQEITDSISQLASQTNLLSLHASIEAAGAGEAGSRFAIVAEEVRQLADESTTAAQHIAQLVTGLQTEIRAVVQNVQLSNQQVEQGYQVAGEAGERLLRIGELSEKSAKLAQDISAAASEQVRSIQNVSQGVQHIAQITEESQESVKQSRSAAEQLQALAQQLNQSLTRFRLPQ